MWRFLVFVAGLTPLLASAAYAQELDSRLYPKWELDASATLLLLGENIRVDPQNQPGEGTSSTPKMRSASPGPVSSPVRLCAGGPGSGMSWSWDISAPSVRPRRCCAIPSMVRRYHLRRRSQAQLQPENQPGVSDLPLQLPGPA